MRRRDFRVNAQPTVMIIPMIDIMLFLLVFFMISTIYMVQTNTLQVNLPQATSANMETRPTVVPITILPDGGILFDKDGVPSGELASRVHAALESNRNVVFVLRGDRSARYESVVAVLDLLKKSGAKHVSIATEIAK